MKRGEETRYTDDMLRYHVAYHLPGSDKGMIYAEVLDFPGVFSQGHDLQDARSMVASALEEIAQLYLEQGRPLPIPFEPAEDVDAYLIEQLPLSIEVAVPH